MYSNRRVRARILRHAHRSEELNLVPMIDIFTVLVTFLLMTAVFYRTMILELNLPGAQPVVQPPAELQLEVVVRKAGLEVGDRNKGLLTQIPSGEGGYDLAALSEYLQRVKQKFPDRLDATLLLEPDVPYDSLVQVMDAVRVAEQEQGGRTVQAELFPEISIGDAPQ
jgi:biopolymer transport protein ExbD